MDIPGVDLPGPGDIYVALSMARRFGGFFGGLAEDAGRAIVEYVIEFIFGLIAQAVALADGNQREAERLRKRRTRAQQRLAARRSELVEVIAV